jgi:hypothetical protein
MMRYFYEQEAEMAAAARVEAGLPVEPFERRNKGERQWA